MKRNVVRYRIQSLPNPWVNPFQFTQTQRAQYAARQCNFELDQLEAIRRSVENVTQQLNRQFNGITPCPECGYNMRADSNGRRIWVCQCVYDALKQLRIPRASVPYHPLCGVEIHVDETAQVSGDTGEL